MLEAIFFGSVFFVFFSYFGYPLTLLAAGWRHGRTVARAEIYPTVSFIITVFNEQARIRDKLDNVLGLVYPGEKLQVLVASDGATDRTNEIVRSYADRGVQLLALTERRGKESAQKDAIQHVGGDILVFSDVATRMEADGLKRLVSNFADPTVGCVSSEDRLVGRDGKPSGEGMYIRYEMWLRGLESRASSLIGLSGSLFAARKEVCADFSSDMQSDFRTVLNSVKLGLRGVSDPHALGLYQDAADPKKEWERKIRTVIRGLTVFFRHLELLNPLGYGVFAYQLFCHKLLRWLVPLFMITAFASNLILASQSRVFAWLFLAQCACYLVALAGALWPRLQESALVRIPMYFVLVNLSILVAWWRYLTGHRIVAWSPTRR